MPKIIEIGQFFTELKNNSGTFLWTKVHTVFQ